MRRTTQLVTTLAVLAASVAPAVAEDRRAPLPVTYSFAEGVLRAGSDGKADPPGANDWSCDPTRRHPRPVVLVHGTGGTKDTNWMTYAPLLSNHGYCVFALTYGLEEPATPGYRPGGMSRIQDSARELGRFVARVRRATGAAKVDLVGHSQGTLMPNYWMKFLGGARFVKRHVSLAPLWHGTFQLGLRETLTRSFGIPQNQELPYCRACAQMSAGSSFLQQMRRGGVAVAGVEYTNIVSRYDQVILPYTSGIERGMRNVVLQDRCASDASDHLEIAASPVAARIVLNTLDPQHRKPVRCTVVLPVVGPLPG